MAYDRVASLTTEGRAMILADDAMPSLIDTPVEPPRSLVTRDELVRAGVQVLTVFSVVMGLGWLIEKGR